MIVVKVLFPTPPFWLEKAMNRVLFFVSISILFLKFHILCTACRLSYVKDCRHPCMLPGNPDIIPVVIRALCRSGIPAFTQAIPMACLPVVLHDWMATGQFSCRQVFLPALWNAVKCAGFPAIRHSLFLKCRRD